MTVLSPPTKRLRRRRRVRAKIRGSAERPRISVFRSNRGVFAQLVDDEAGRTVGSGSWPEPGRRGGELPAGRAKQAGVEACVFDRGSYRYHGRVRALAEAAREGGLRF